MTGILGATRRTGHVIRSISLQHHRLLQPSWALLPLLPLALMPEKVGAVVLTCLHFLCYIITAHKLGAKPVTIALFMLLPNVAMWGYGFANIDWMVVGFILPPQIGLFLVLVKPQLGLAVAIYWLVEAWRMGRAKLVMSTFLPVTLAYLASFLLYGLWPLKMQLVFGQLNTSLWPMAIPIGLVLLFSALRKEKNGTGDLSVTFFITLCGDLFLANRHSGTAACANRDDPRDHWIVAGWINSI